QKQYFPDKLSHGFQILMTASNLTYSAYHKTKRIKQQRFLVTNPQRRRALSGFFRRNGNRADGFYSAASQTKMPAVQPQSAGIDAFSDKREFFQITERGQNCFFFAVIAAFAKTQPGAGGFFFDLLQR